MARGPSTRRTPFEHGTLQEGVVFETELALRLQAAIRAGLSLSGMKSRVQRGRQALEQLLHDCCWIELDAGGRIMDYQFRETPFGSCTDGCG